MDTYQDVGALTAAGDGAAVGHNAPCALIGTGDAAVKAAGRQVQAENRRQQKRKILVPHCVRAASFLLPLHPVICVLLAPDDDAILPVFRKVKHPKAHFTHGRIRTEDIGPICFEEECAMVYFRSLCAAGCTLAEAPAASAVDDDVTFRRTVVVQVPGALERRSSQMVRPGLLAAEDAAVGDGELVTLQLDLSAVDGAAMAPPW